ncbi:polymorphic transmembrane cluster 2 transmembrane protein 2 [Biomphalaria glabrata]
MMSTFLKLWNVVRLTILFVGNVGVLLVYCSFILYLTVVLTCPVAEDGKPYNLSHTWTYNENYPLEIAWKEKKNVVAKCSLEKGCTDYEKSDVKSSLKRLENSRFISSLLIYKVDRRHLHTNWTLIYLGHMALLTQALKTCNMTVFARADRLQCSKVADEIEVLITCRASRIFPEGICQIIVFDNESLPRSTTVSSQNNETSVPDVYFDTQCIIALPISKLQYGINAVSVIVYPNVTNSEDDLRFGTKETVQFKIQRAFKESSICIPTVENDSILVECKKRAVFPVMLCEANATKNGVRLFFL